MTKDIDPPPHSAKTNKAVSAIYYKVFNNSIIQYSRDNPVFWSWSKNNPPSPLIIEFIIIFQFNLFLAPAEALTELNLT